MGNIDRKRGNKIEKYQLFSNLQIKVQKMDFEKPPILTSLKWTFWNVTYPKSPSNINHQTPKKISNGLLYLKVYLKRHALRHAPTD